MCTDENSSSTEWADLEELLDYQRCFDGCDAPCGDEEDVRVSGATFGLGDELARHGYVVWLCLFICIDFGTRDMHALLSHDAQETVVGIIQDADRHQAWPYKRLKFCSVRLRFLCLDTGRLCPGENH